jgi:hypothetical protein
MVALVRPSLGMPPPGHKGVSLVPPLVLGMLLLGISMLAHDEVIEKPTSLTIDAVGLKRLTVDKSELQDFPKWSKSIEDINAAEVINHGLWAYYKGPPFLQRVTMYSGDDVDLNKNAEFVRKILGVPVNFGKWEGNHYIRDFDSQQMFYLQSNEHSVLIIPPLSEKEVPTVSYNGKKMLRRYASKGHNTLIVVGGTGAVDFMNKFFFANGKNEYIIAGLHAYKCACFSSLQEQGSYLRKCKFLPEILMGARMK